MHLKQTNEKGQRCETAVLDFIHVFFLLFYKRSVSLLGGFLSGKVGVSRQVEGMVIQVSTSGAAPAETMKTTTACRLLLLAKPQLSFYF